MIIYISDGAEEDNFSYNKLKCIDYVGNLLFDKDFKDLYNTNENNNICYLPLFNNSIDKIYKRQPDRLLMVSTFSCLHEMINPYRIIEDHDDDTNVVIFKNCNGDYFLDNG